MLPPRDGAATTPGDFTTLTGNNGGNWLDGKSTAQLQHWRDSGTTLTILKNETVHFVGAPGGESAMGQSGQIVRLTDGTLLAAFCKTEIFSICACSRLAKPEPYHFQTATRRRRV